MQTIFLLGNQRTGTKYLSLLFAKNIVGCVAKHEPGPDMFGKAIMWKHQGDLAKIEDLFLKKKGKIESLVDAKVYFESNHSFLKSFDDVAMKHYPNMKLIRTARNPILAAKSALNRRNFSKVIPPQFNNFIADDGETYWRWDMFKLSELYPSLPFEKLSPFQYYIVEHLEVERLTDVFLNKYNKHDDCFLLKHSLLSDSAKLSEMVEFLGLETKYQEIKIPRRKNINHIKTKISDEELNEWYELLDILPDELKNVLNKSIYSDIRIAQLELI